MPSAGQIIRALDFTDAAGQTVTASGTSGSTTYTATLTGSTAAGVAFVAPSSGRVIVHNRASMVNSGANDTYTGWALKTGSTIGSGSAVTGSTGSTDTWSIRHNGTTSESQGNASLVTGLTPGASYNVQQVFRVSGGTGTYTNREIVVEPVS